MLKLLNSIVTKMISQTTLNQERSAWQDALKNLITCPKKLLSQLNLSESKIPWYHDLNFPCRVPQQFVDLMEKGNPNDPLLRQVLPTTEENTQNLPQNPDQSHSDLNSDDPLQERKANPIPGLLHKYHGRVLLTLTEHCALHCRYCCRKHFPFKANQLNKDNFANICLYLEQHPEVHEVILSGGDPLSLPDRSLAKLTQQIAKIPHIKILRFHTRFGVVIPERLCPELFGMLANLKIRTVMVFHCNHPNEISKKWVSHLEKLQQNTNTLLLNQAVLLKGVNDNLETLTTLSHKLFEAGVLPYYLHALDNIPGTNHFEVENEKAKTLHQKLQATLPGYLVPKFVKEVPNEPNKQPIF